jgi:integrase
MEKKLSSKAEEISDTKTQSTIVAQTKTPAPTSGVKDGIYKRGPNWYIRCMVDGRLERKSAGRNKELAKAMLAEIKSRRAAKRITGEMSGMESFFKRTKRKRFAEAADDYLAERPNLKESTKRSYSEIFSNHLKPAFGKLNVNEITEESVAQFQAKLANKVSATRVNNIMGPLRYILKICVRRKLISDNPAINVLPLREDEPNIDPLTFEELNQVIAALQPYARPLFVTLAWTGARPDELFALRWDDVDLERCEIRIDKGRVRGTEGKTKTKAGKRVIHMLSLVKEALTDAKRRPTQHIDGYVFLNKHGKPYDKHVDREWRTALKKAGVKHRRSYELRHTFASLCLQQGLEPTWVAKMLGHSTAQITFKYYARFINDKSSMNEQRLEEFIAEKKGSANRAQLSAQRES